MTDILGTALSDYFYKTGKQKLWIHNRYGKKEEMPVITYFRNEDQMPDMEWLALEQCYGKVLDIGAGAGAHSLALQHRHLHVTAIDRSPGAVAVMRMRGIKQAVEADILLYTNDKFDTLLLLMNGIGLAGTLTGLEGLLQHLKTLLAPGGQILFDSSDVVYLFSEKQKLPDHYYGEIWYCYEYNGQRADWFQWLYIDEQTMHIAATTAGFTMEVLLEDEFGQYLARLT